MLQARRSSSNYRYYTEDELERLRLIVEYKRNKYTLEEIKVFLLKKEQEETDVEQARQELTCKLAHINQELKEVISFLEKNKHNKPMLNQHVSHESITLIQSLTALFLV